MRKTSVCLLIIALFAFPVIAQVTSVLWGVSGEAWNTNGLLQDFMDVGYMQGNQAIPDWPVWTNLTDLGAVVDDQISDVKVLNEAISNCPPYHAIFLPNGRYIIDDQVDLSADNIVIRGESRDRTILFFPLHMTEIERVSQSSTPFFNFSGGTNRGIENVSLVCRDEEDGTGWAAAETGEGIHWFNSGEVPVRFSNGEQNSWIRNVYIKNANYAVTIADQKTRYITAQDIVLDQFIGREMHVGDGDNGNVGHMGIKISEGAAYSLFHNVLLTGQYSHDVCMMDSDDSVFSRVTGPNMELDHHASGNTYNLYTEIDTGEGGRGYGGEATASQTGETYWGIKGVNTASYITTAGGGHVMVGIHTTSPTDITSTYHHETLDPDLLEPANIYVAQMTNTPGKITPSNTQLTLPVIPADVPAKIRSDACARYNGVVFWKFDLSRLSITNAAKVTLRIYCTSADGFDLTIQEVADNGWTEQDISAGNLPTLGSAVCTQTVDQTGWMQWDITPYVNSELAGAETTVSMAMDTGGGDFFRDRTLTEIPYIVVEPDVSTAAIPAAPANLVAIIGDDMVTLDWDDHSEADVVTYNVYRKKAGGSYLVDAMGLIWSRYEDFVVDNGTTYSYYVTAVDSAGNESPVSAEVSSTPEPPPAAPTGLTATAGNGSVSLSWNSNTEGDFDRYSVYRRTDFSVYSSALKTGLTSTNYNDNSVSNGITYYYVVTAVDTNNLESTQGSEDSALPVDPGNQAPSFSTNKIVEINAIEGSSYRAAIAGVASDPESDPMSFSLVDGPGWLSVASDGGLSGSPGSADLGLNRFTVQVSAAGGAGLATLEITVDSAEAVQLTSELLAGGDLGNDTEHSYNLTEWGQNDWKMWNTSLTSPKERKVGGNGISSLTYTPGNGGGSIGGLITGKAPFYSWTDGTPTASRTNTEIKNALRSATTSETGDTLSFTAAASSGGKATLYLVAGVIEGTLRVTASLPGTADQKIWVENTGNNPNCYLYKIVYTTDNDSVVLTVTLKKTQSDAAGHIFIQSAALTVEDTAPAPPAGLTANAGNGSASLNWSANTESDMGTYSVYRSTVSGIYGLALTNGLSTTNYVDSTVENGTTYYYVVSATDTNSNESALSAEDSATSTAPQVTGYDLWATGWNTDIGSATNDLDADGLTNLGEYAMGVDPTNSAVKGSQPVLSKSGNGFIYVHPMRSDDGSITYTVETTTNLISGVWTNTGCVAVGTNVTGGSIDFVTNDVGTVEKEKFIRLRIEQ